MLSNLAGKTRFCVRFFASCAITLAGLTIIHLREKTETSYQASGNTDACGLPLNEAMKHLTKSPRCEPGAAQLGIEDLEGVQMKVSLAT